MPISIVGSNGKGEQVVVEIDGTKTTIKTAGFQGRSCQNATAALELALGTKTTDTPTAEMFSTAAAQKVGQR
mgnify:CR=1 FL=1